MLELLFRNRRYLILGQVLWWTGILGVIGGPFPAAGLALALAAQLLLYIVWMRRAPGGLKGWRLGLMLIPGVNLVWNLMESMWLPLEIMRGAGWPRKVTALLLMVLAALLLPLVLGMELVGCWKWAQQRVGNPDEFLAYAAVVKVVWAAAFGFASAMLGKAAGRLEIQPSSARKRNLQLALVFGGSLFMVILAFFGWTAGAHLQLKRVTDGLARAGYPADPALAEDRHFLEDSPYGHLRIQAHWGGFAQRGDLQGILQMDLDRLEVVVQLADVLKTEEAAVAGIRLFELAAQALDGNDAEGFRRALEGLMRLSGTEPVGYDITSEAIVAMKGAALDGLTKLSEEDLNRIDAWSREREAAIWAYRERDTRAAVAMLTALSREELIRQCPDWADEVSTGPEWLPWNVNARCDALRWAFGLDIPKRLYDPGIRLYSEIVHRLESRRSGYQAYVRELRLLRVVLAYERYRRDHGRFPVSPELLDCDNLRELLDFYGRLAVSHGGSEITVMRDLYDENGNETAIEYRYFPGIAVSYSGGSSRWQLAAPPEYCPPEWDMTPTREDKTSYWDEEEL